MPGAAANPIRRLTPDQYQASVAAIFREHASMVWLSLRRLGVPEADIEDLSQEVFVVIHRRLSSFEGRSSLKTWVFTIVANRARTRATREGRTVPLSSIGSADEDGGLDADRFASGGGWLRPPSGWAVDSPESLTLALEGSGLVSRVLEGIPPMQATVVTLRDVDGLGSKEVCNLLEITESNQRVLLHRGRARLRAAIEEWLAGEANQAED